VVKILWNNLRGKLIGILDNEHFAVGTPKFDYRRNELDKTKKSEQKSASRETAHNKLKKQSPCKTSFDTKNERTSRNKIPAGVGGDIV